MSLARKLAFHRLKANMVEQQNNVNLVVQYLVFDRSEFIFRLAH